MGVHETNIGLDLTRLIRAVDVVTENSQMPLNLERISKNSSQLGFYIVAQGTSKHQVTPLSTQRTKDLLGNYSTSFENQIEYWGGVEQDSYSLSNLDSMQVRKLVEDYASANPNYFCAVSLPGKDNWIQISSGGENLQINPKVKNN